MGEDDKVQHLLGLVLVAKEAELARLRSDLKEKGDENRRLWLAVAQLQQAAGVAVGWINAGKLPDKEVNSDHFNNTVDYADTLLGGLVALTPAGGK